MAAYSSILDTTLVSSILAWEIPWTEKPGGLQSMGSKELNMTQQLNNNILYKAILF